MDDLWEPGGNPEAVLAAFRHSPVINLVMEGPDFTIVAANDQVSEFVGDDRSWIGRPYRETFSEVLGQGYLDLLQRVYETGEPATVREWRVEHQLPGGDTIERYINLFVTPWLDDAGVRGIIGQGIDVTEEVTQRQEAEAAGAESERAQMAALDLVRALQDSLLPGTLPVVSGLQTAARYLLAADDTAAGGDWLDVIPLEDGRVALVVGDVVGHGVAASALMGQLRAVLGERLAAGAGIAESLHALDRVAARLPDARAATVVVAEVDPASGRASYCTAGHPPPLLVSGSGTRFAAPSGGRPLVTGGAFPVAEVRLEVGDQLLLYSDGLIERPGRVPAQSTVELATVAAQVAAGEVFGEAGLREVDRMCEQLLELLTRDTGYGDDITLLATQRVTTPEPAGVSTQARPAALREVRRAITSWLEPLDVRPLDEMAMQHAVGECVTNAVDHAYRDRDEDGDRPLEVTIALDGPGDATVVVADGGSWRYGEREELGRGLQMVNTMTDRMSVERQPDGTRVTLTCPLSRTVTLMRETSSSGSVRVSRDGELAVDQSEGTVTARGAVDLVSVDDFRNALLRVTSGGLAEVRVDLSGLTLLASCGVQALYDALDRATEQGISLRLVASPGSPAQHVLDVVGLPHEPPQDG